MGDAVPRPSNVMRQAMEELWRLRPPGPDNLLATPALMRLREACRNDYANVGKGVPRFALLTALRSLGLPWGLPQGAAFLTSPVEAAVLVLDYALRATHGYPRDTGLALTAVSFWTLCWIKVGDYPTSLIRQWPAPRNAITT
jgi:hypothetical protein